MFNASILTHLPHQKNNFQKTGHVYINKHMEHVTKWIEQQAVNAKHFVTLNFAFDVSRQQMEKAVRAFQNRVSQAIAGNDARKGRYQHQMVITCERQPISQRWHLHILMDGVPAQYQARVKERGHGLRVICAKSWDSMVGTGKTRKTGGESVSIENGIPTFHYKWFKPITTLTELADYVSKTYPSEGSDFIVI